MIATLIALLTPFAHAQQTVFLDPIVSPVPVEDEACGLEEDCRWVLIKYNKYDHAFQCLRPDRSFCPRDEE